MLLLIQKFTIMKKIFYTFILLWSFTFIKAQDKIYVHTATASNISGHVTYIDHPDLNNNPNANIVFCHVRNPNGTSVVSNNNVDGLWYDASAGKWTIYNEDYSPMVDGAKFFIYLAADPDDVITHVADASNIIDTTTTIYDPDFIGHDPGPFAVFSHYWNPNQVYNPYIDGFDYYFGYRIIYNEYNGVDINYMLTGAAFKILKKTSMNNGVITMFTHYAIASNTALQGTMIDNPHLNGNPNATFVFSHYYGVGGASTEVEVPYKISAFYSTTNNRWYLVTENNSAFPVGAAFDIIVAPQDTTSAIEQLANPENIKLYPNPVNSVAIIAADQPVSHISIVNLLGQQVGEYSYQDDQKQVEISVSGLSSGTYTVNVHTKTDVIQVLKMVKK